MRRSTGLLALITLAAATPIPQHMDLSAIVEPDEVAPPVTIPMGEGALNDTITPHAKLLKRDWDCSGQVLGSGPVPSTDTPEAFLAFSKFSDVANGAKIPEGYSYMGYFSLSSYDTEACAAKCSTTKGCLSFNILFERDPEKVPAIACPNPASTTVIKCVLWGTVLSPETATNDGQWRNDFRVVIAGSNGYVRNPSAAESVPGYTGTFVGNKAVNAPSDCNGRDTYITYKELSDGAPFDPSRCATACEAESRFNIDHLNSRSICRFFNTYILMKNGVPQAQICSMYNTTWPNTPDVISNEGQWRGSDHYTIAYSEIYSNDADPGQPICDSDISYLRQPENAAFCSSYIKYVAPTSIVSAGSTISTVTVTTVDSTVTSTPNPVTTSTIITSYDPTTVVDTVTTTVTQPAPARLRRFANNATTTAYSINTDIWPYVDLPASVVSSLIAASPDLAKRAALPTPASFANWPGSLLSAACSQVATDTITETQITATSTVFTTTQTVISTTIDVAPTPTTTIATTLRIATTIRSTTTSTTTVQAAAPARSCVPIYGCFTVKDTISGGYMGVDPRNFATLSTTNKAIFKQYAVGMNNCFLRTSTNLVYSDVSYRVSSSVSSTGFLNSSYFRPGISGDSSVEFTTCRTTPNAGLQCIHAAHESSVLLSSSTGQLIFYHNPPASQTPVNLVRETVACPAGF
ncbi:hypothetical protein COCMIDRAFT_8886 [Bipolaris oryzae ATCC 44560]|uniref:Apple domain-containing protein n=1 Tax=Bipolaris oryzae ATCC 44560 TaxID=930090 RepID=W6YV05_COCMI|nr:uncharacterized protein COCMIDRAFT_8886 [Bipolaris oryzae ATCC 44560]EUC41388.1 hypothetical protein COCMIDRAFT_8886 [Bipolaris oryzae ATCC 44560]